MAASYSKISTCCMAAAFVYMLNDVADWTDPYDKGCDINDEDFSFAYGKFRRASFGMDKLEFCDVPGMPCGPLRHCPICSPAPGN